jgi:ribosomal protein L28
METVQLDKTPHDWIQNIDSVIAAQKVWTSGAYRDEITAHFTMDMDAPFRIVCGAGLVAAHVRKFRFNPKVMASLGRLTDKQGRPIFDESFLNHLQRLALRLEMNMPAEGTLLLPGQPLAIIKGTRLQVMLLQSALEELIGNSTYWATTAAMVRWNAGDLKELDTPNAPNLPANRAGWKLRALYIGGGDITKSIGPKHLETEGALHMHEGNTRATLTGQIRRLFKGNIPLADVQLTDAQDVATSVSKTTMKIVDAKGEAHSIKFGRFLKLYQPVLVKGHAVLASPQLALRRQRTLHQMQAFHECGLGNYMTGSVEV